jgi:LDH2 family malate/lactate/ureidoglycolate dehydrogenase
MTTHDNTMAYSAQALLTFAADLLRRAGLPDERAGIVAEILVEGDLMGHSTHGLNLLPAYLQDLETGAMAKDGQPEVIADTGANLTWNGRYLPGPWLVVEAIDLACARAKDHPVVTIAIQHSHHIACLAAFPKRATDQGLILLLASSDPNEKAVAPYGGIEPLYTPNPLAAGIPTQGKPIILDISTSTTAMGLVGRLQKEGKHLPHPWLMDNQGNITDDPADFFTNPRGSVLPLGGAELGYKGFALGILIEVLTSALAGHGRSNPSGKWGASVFLQVIDPAAFGGRDFFLQETEWLAEACRSNPTRPGDPPVRLPGSRGLELRDRQMREGVALYPAIMPALIPWAEKLAVAVPVPL